MKFIVFAGSVLFSMLSFAQTYPLTGTDFAPFPLSVSNTVMIEGRWAGEAIDIKVSDTGSALAGKPLLWIEVKRHQTGDSKLGLLYYSASQESYLMHMFYTGENILVDLGIFEFSSSYASDTGSSCKSGGTLMKLEFQLDSVIGEVVLTKERCLQ